MSRESCAAACSGSNSISVRRGTARRGTAHWPDAWRCAGPAGAGLHWLYPLNETYVTEIEREIYNVGLANQAPAGIGIRYFALLHNRKNPPTAVGSCCESQGTRLYGSLPEYIYSHAPDGIYVDLYTASSMSCEQQGERVVLTTITDFPRHSSVTLRLNMTAPASFALYLRIPSWSAVVARNVSVYLNGRHFVYATVGTYVRLSRTWFSGDLVQLDLPMGLRASLYTGLNQVGTLKRYAYEYGPILLAAQGPWNATLDTVVIPRAGDPMRPADWLVPESCAPSVVGGYVLENETLSLACEPGSGAMERVDFASYGTPIGTCGAYAVDASCHAPASVDRVRSLCVGKTECRVPADSVTFGGDPCTGIIKALAVQLSGCRAARSPARPMVFSVRDHPQYSFVPYYGIQAQRFTVYPAIGAA